MVAKASGGGGNAVAVEDGQGRIKAVYTRTASGGLKGPRDYSPPLSPLMESGTPYSRWPLHAPAAGLGSGLGHCSYPSKVLTRVRGMRTAAQMGRHAWRFTASVAGDRGSTFTQ